MTNSISDLAEADAYLVIGSNTTENHPIIGDLIKRTITGKGAKLVVIDPRRIPLVDYANVYLQVPPGYNIPVLGAMMNVMLSEGLADEAYIAERCEGWEEFKASLEAFDPESVAELTGLDVDLIREAGRIYGEAKPASILYAMGVTQHSQGTDGVKSLANLAMMGGNVGVPGGGVNPLRGQNNVQGACDMGALPNVFTGYQKVDVEEARLKFEQAWGVKLPTTPGLKLTEMTQAAEAGTIKALYIMGENPMMTDPDTNHIEKALEKLDLLIVQDIFLTETAKKADVVFPAVTFAEKDGTFTNTERRVQRVRKGVAPVGEARLDWRIIGALSGLMGMKMEYADASAIFDELASLTPSYAGMNYARIDKVGLQWPCPDSEHEGTPILHTAGFARGKGLFQPVSYVGPAEKPDADYPLVLTTGREHAHYHCGSMTRRSAKINKNYPEGFMEVNPVDAEKLGIASGDKVSVASRRGEITTRVKVVESTAPGVVFMSFHYAESPVNVLTNPALCPTAKIPELKVCAVNVQKV
jgi:formate dehydrogenase alpha subunit